MGSSPKKNTATSSTAPPAPFPAPTPSSSSSTPPPSPARSGRGSAKRARGGGGRRSVVGCATAVVALSIFAVARFGGDDAGGWGRGGSSRRRPSSSSVRRAASAASASSSATTVFQAIDDDDDGPAARRRRNRSRAAIVGGGEAEYRPLNAAERRRYLVRRGAACLPSSSSSGGAGDKNVVLERYDALMASDRPSRSHFAVELWKYCALYAEGGAYLDADGPLLATFSDAFPASGEAGGGSGNYAALGPDRFPRTAHGSILVLREAGSDVAGGMVRRIAETSGSDLDADPLLLPRALHDLIARDVGREGEELRPGRSEDGRWTVLETRCGVFDPISNSRRGGGGGTVEGWATSPEGHRLTHGCPSRSGHCCEISDPSSDGEAVLVTRHPLLPYQVLPPASALPRPYGAADADDADAADLPFISTVRETVHERPASDGKKNERLTPNFFEILLSNDCLPSDKFCSECLRNKKGANCDTCGKVCKCYCKSLCSVKVERKFVAKDVTVTPPRYARDLTRLVPRIVHQTWFEDVTQEKYPNMSRLIESWKRSGWEYRFYTDADAASFLARHFPPEVKDAYDSLKPGAFKADLFRYCALLIDGGVYADMDVLLESNLDAAVAPDVGFMTPIDEPGKLVDRRMCLWNGFIAAAPGHPYLARAVENVVNNVRNRFTSVDVDNLLCPNPELSVSHAFDTLFTAGPCVLGLSVNEVLGRHPQTQFEAGDVDPWDGGGEGKNKKGAAAAMVDDDDPRRRIPGRTVVLHQDKWDMGAHRFTWLEHNLVVAATDMPDYDDRKSLEDGNEHYSKTHVRTGIYGLEKLYANDRKANEDVRIVVGDAAAAAAGGG